MYAKVHIQMSVVWRVKDNLVDLFLSFYYVDPGMECIRLDGKCTYTSLFSLLFFVEVAFNSSMTRKYTDKDAH